MAPPVGARKYGAPLYACAWPAPGVVLLGGGGGKKSSGIPNRLVLVAATGAPGEPLGGELASVTMEDMPPTRVAAHPGGEVVAAAAGDGVALWDLSAAAGEEAVAPREAGGGAALVVAGETKSLAFGAGGALLATGGAEGRLRVWAHPAGRVVADAPSAHGDAVTDVAFSPDGALLLSTSADGKGAAVWKVPEGAAAAGAGGGGPAKLSREATLSAHGCPGKGRVVFRGGAFAPDGSAAYTGVNAGGVGFVVRWDTDGWKRAAGRKALADPLTALALSPSGDVVAVGGAEGHVAILSAHGGMAPLRFVKGAHMVFVTGLAFSPDGSAVLSVSADAGALATPVPAAGAGELRRFVLYFLLGVLLSVVFVLARDRLAQVAAAGSQQAEEEAEAPPLLEPTPSPGAAGLEGEL